MRRKRSTALLGSGLAVKKAKRPNRWKMQDAKAQFSRVVKLAREVGPQRVTYRGKDAVVVMSVGDYERVSPTPKMRPSLYAVMSTSPLGRLTFESRGVKSRVREPEF